MEGQLNSEERRIICETVREIRPKVALEVGTWLGGGSTLHILRTLCENNQGHLWGIEAFQEIYDRMIANISQAGTEVVSRFTPLFGFSDKVIPQFLHEHARNTGVDFVFLDGGDNPMEQVIEFQLLADSIPVGGALLSHDAKLRKGKWLVPYLKAHDNWQCVLHDVSPEGLFEARKTAPHPSEASLYEARKTLRQSRCEPTEVVGRLLPSKVINLILKLLPDRLVKKVTQGRG